ncbi:aminoacyl-tRNA deacylase [Tersicoccus phoenicis]|uniref:Cys-tRNA(Pro)/Cys-tRNA(Cys) deacylase n=1 Tax=Tersicoccus phoenicis TaxID=554083 RepID=A0A1R1LL27_9MICC|nr:Cys-tRNA(Pro) deacylase [Tersicoccus phoenicis]OMH28176.1 aminoacyl-tRNA deacylase [Tersicoccus phoenicis]
MARHGGPRGTPATRVLAAAGVPFTERPYPHDPAVASFGREAAEALGVDPARVFKTLVVDTGAGLAVGIVPVDATLDLKRMAAVLGVKRMGMADVNDSERVTGYVAGGISPLGQRRRLTTVLDATALDHDTVLVSGGRRGFDVELRPDDLVTLTSAVIAVVAAR